MERCISHSVDPNKLMLELPEGATSLETALLALLPIRAREVDLQLLLAWGLGKTGFSTVSAACVVNKDFVFLTWAVLSGNLGN